MIPAAAALLALALADAPAQAPAATKPGVTATQSPTVGPPASSPSTSPATRDDPETRQAVRAAVDRGLAYLKRRQDRLDGSFLFSPGDASQRQPERDTYAPLADVALATLAWLADGNTEGRGPYHDEVKRSVDFLLRSATFDTPTDASGRALAEEAYLNVPSDTLSRMHGHGYATLALAQVYGMAGGSGGPKREEAIRRVLVAAVRLIERAQGETGGWYYTPKAHTDHEGSVTITLVQALRAARNSGIAVDTRVIARAIDYVRRSQDDDGSFRYRINDGTTERTPALTAAAISTLNATGDYDSTVVDRGIRHLLLKFAERREYGVSRALAKFPVYERFYTAQALRQYRDPEVLADWFRKERAMLLKTQSEGASQGVDVDGSWPDRYGRIFATAVNCIVLRIEDSYLPILQR